TVSAALSVAPAGLIQVVDSNDVVTLSGVTNILTGGQLKLIDTSNDSQATELNITGTFNNGGSIQLTTTSGSAEQVTLDFTGGTVTNQTSGVIQVDAGTGGARTIVGSFTNLGTLDINTNTHFTTGFLTNRGVIDLAAGTTLEIGSGTDTLVSGAGASYT